MAESDGRFEGAGFPTANKDYFATKETDVPQPGSIFFSLMAGSTEPAAGYCVGAPSLRLWERNSSVMLQASAAACAS